MNSNKSPQDFPYKTYLNILHGPLEPIDVQKLVEACTDKWYNQTLCKVNDSVVRLAVSRANITGTNIKTSMNSFSFSTDISSSILKIALSILRRGRASLCPKACAIARAPLNEP